MHVRSVTDDDLDIVVATVARWQLDPGHHIGYLSCTPDGIREDLTGLEPNGVSEAVGAWQGSSLIGFLAAEWDTTPPRVWWHGPFARDADIASVLYTEAHEHLPTHVTQEEIAADDRHDWMPGFADRHGFIRSEAAAVLTLGPDRAPPPAESPVRPLTADDTEGVTALHDLVFPGTHTPGSLLVSGKHHDVLLAAGPPGAPTGYIAAERQADGEGYIDFVGVAPESRGRGIGRSLIVAAVHALRESGCTSINLTVLETNRAARSLYSALGFTEERILRPWRKGFV
ncbi:MAG: GNAT family N-acetyltransferase [Acidimicrobiia bacterium]|nr:GNAT family N-acetyltransferase [Acidimicrobiia bacterium]MDH4308498.1 GNAT family N-acetyltransferase [Acidimicrobiia bacterium]MDH5294234.1 GNAT family N-acetyltransferase [Acidimicrobiia bacterium]